MRDNTDYFLGQKNRLPVSSLVQALNQEYSKQFKETGMLCGGRGPAAGYEIYGKSDK